MDLKSILASHAAWARGKDGTRADLGGADLRGAYLRGADLHNAYLRDAGLRDAYLVGAYLRGADLRGADLRGAYLRGADLRGAYLRGADLRGADLRGAYLRGADLRDALGIVVLPVGDVRYTAVAVATTDGYRIAAGCRWFTPDEARAHWGAADYHTPWLGSLYVRAVDWLEAWDTFRHK